jgi:hypothetical protein
VNSCINSETECPHLLTLSHTDYPPQTRLRISTFAVSIGVQIHLYHIYEIWLIMQKTLLLFALSYFTPSTHLHTEKQEELLFQYIKYGFNKPC